MIVGQRELTKAEVRQYVRMRLEDEIAKRHPNMRPFDVKKQAQKCLTEALKGFGDKRVYVRIEKYPATRLEALKEAYAPQWLLRRWPVKYITVERA